MASQPFLRYLVVGGSDMSCILFVLNIEADTLHAVHLLHVDETVLKRSRPFMGKQRTSPVATFFTEFVVKVVYLCQMLSAVYACGDVLGLCEKTFGLFAVSLGYIYSSDGDKRVQRVPLVLGTLHQVVGFVVFRQGLVKLMRLLIEVAEIGVAESYAERIAILGVEFH